MRRRRGNSPWLKAGAALALLAWGSSAALALELEIGRASCRERV